MSEQSYELGELLYRHLATEIDEAELAIRIMERALMMKRSDGKISRDLLAESRALIVASGDDFPFDDMARIAIEYFR